MDLLKDNERVKKSSGAGRSDCGFSIGACGTHNAASRLVKAGVRITREGMNLARLLFQDGDRHFTVESLFEEADLQNAQLSLSEIDDTLQQFTSAGLVRRLSIDGQKTWYDTNTTEHHHFYCEEDDCIVDIEDGEVLIGQMPPIPHGMEVAGVEVVVRLRQRCK
ncbi:transcriptional repressor [Hyphomicrobium methylovorum]|uniref:iron response transcriptional regulator IrrA n=1 Tax=Hyphomicrobium methylovorum TaxID=84 RepID=UPI0015E67937|nr:transcriptional repressor [Hyphomicrobium methylovorum]MBA2126960.1 transcriptional repressor [Hyphomicrobium methylovorum]